MSTNELRLDTAASHVPGMDAAWQEFNDKGYVVFERAIEPSVLAGMYAVWLEYFEPFRKRRKPEIKRFPMHLPFKAPLYHPSFVEHPSVLALADRLLGKRYVCGYFGSETPLPGADYMQAHFDLMFLSRMTFMNAPLGFANRLLGTLRYFYGIQVSVPLVDSRDDNGPFEIWPASNRWTPRRPAPERLLMPAGSLLVRDIRNLHRGTPHRGTAPRPFLSLVYLRSWVPRWKLPEIPAEVYASLPARSQRLFSRARIGQHVPDPEAWAERSR
jgi:hypothetical protein